MNAGLLVRKIWAVSRSGRTLTFNPQRLAATAALAVCAVLTVWGSAAAQAVEEAPRYVPAVRGPRASYGTEQVQQWREAVDAYPWPTDTALLVISCESQGDPGAINPSSGAAGLFQLYSWGWLAARMFGTRNVLIPWVNIGVAFALWEDSGGRFGFHWAASRSCWGV